MNYLKQKCAGPDWGIAVTCHSKFHLPRALLISYSLIFKGLKTINLEISNIRRLCVCVSVSERERGQPPHTSHPLPQNAIPACSEVMETQGFPLAKHHIHLLSNYCTVTSEPNQTMAGICYNGVSRTVSMQTSPNLQADKPYRGTKVLKLGSRPNY